MPELWRSLKRLRRDKRMIEPKIQIENANEAFEKWLRLMFDWEQGLSGDIPTKHERALMKMAFRAGYWEVACKKS